MKRIAVCVAGFHRGNTGEYMISAFRTLGASVTLLSKDEFYLHIQSATTFDYFFCVDSGETFDFSKLPRRSYEGRLGMWYIDYRHNKNRPDRIPTDRQNALELAHREAMIFQAQYEDYEELLGQGISRTVWLPVGADPDVWRDTPKPVEKKFDIGFIGNVWDEARKSILEEILRSGLTLGFPGHGRAWKEDAATILRASKIGFNISSFYGTSVAYDLNMRFFETLSCGIPIVTNWVPTLDRLLPSQAPFVRTYSSRNEVIPLLQTCLQDDAFLNSGAEGREWIQREGTYALRAQSVLAQP